MAIVVLTTDGTALFLTTLATFGLMLKVFVVAFATGNARARAGDRSPEDGRMLAFIGTPQALAYGFAKPGNDVCSLRSDATPEQRAAAEKWGNQVTRLLRVINNDMENIPTGLFVAWASLLSLGASDLATTVHNVAVTAFFIARLLHTVTYVLRVQPWRSLMYFVGIIAVMVLGVNALAGSLELAELA